MDEEIKNSSQEEIAEEEVSVENETTIVEEKVIDEEVNLNETKEKKNKSFLGKKKENAEVLKLQKELETQKQALDEQNEKYTRLAAEYDNYRKRTTKEIDQRYNDAKCDVWKNIITVVDDFERVLNTQIPEECKNYSDGVSLIYKKLQELMKSAGIEEIPALNEQFDPQLHNAVMHIESDEAGENEVVEVFMKGYKLADKVIRCSMVKVAN